MAVTKRDGSKFWYIQFQFNGKTFIKSSKTTDKQLAHDIESQWRMQLIKQHQLGTKAPIDIPKAFQIFTNSKEDIKTHPRLVSYCSYAIEYWSHLEHIHQISTEEIEQYRNHLHAIGLSNATIKHKLHPVGATIKYAKKLGYQTSEVEMPKVKVTKGRLRYLPNFISAPDDQAMGSEVIHLGKILEAQIYSERLICSVPVQETEYLRMQEIIQNDDKDDRLTPDEFLSFQRMKLEIFYCRQIDLQMITDDNRWKLRKQFSVYTRLIDKTMNSDFQDRNGLITTDRLRKDLAVLAEERAVPFLLRGILSSTPIFLKNEFINDVEFTSTDLKKFIQVCIKLKSIIERQLDINIRKDIKLKPASQLGVFLNLIGIKTVKSRTEKTINGGKTYFYKIEHNSLLQMKNLIALEEQRKNPWEAINTRYGFKTA